METAKQFSPYDDAKSIFEKLDWTLTAEQIEDRAERIMEERLAKIEEVEAIPKEDRTFENTIWDLALHGAEMSDLQTTISFPGSISTDKEIRDASTAAQQKLSEFFVEIGLRESLYNAVMEYVDKDEDLEPQDQRLVDFNVRDFKRKGFHLDREVRDQLKELWKEENKLAIQFRQNINEDDTKLKFPEEELEGTPSNIMNSLEQDEEGNYIVEMTAPNVVGIVQNCEIAETRKQVQKAWMSRCIEDNTEILDRLVEIRDEAANLLGYDNHAEYKLEIKMAEKPERVMDFLYDLYNRLKPHGEDELQILSALKKEDVGENGEATIYLHDRPYYSKKWKENEFDIDMEEVKQYLPLTHVVNSMLEFYQDIFGFNFVIIENAPVWHEDVTCYAIYDDTTDDFKGVFYLDMYPRPGTYGHAAAFTLLKGRQYKDGSYSKTASAMVCNFNKPTETEPSLLTTGQVTTLFHEFGHIIHQTTTTAKHSRFSGTSVQRDFVEAPSQMLENWVFEPEVVKQISKHQETGDPLPADMVEKLKKYDRALPGLFNLRQLHFGIFDMKIHTKGEVDTASLYNSLAKEIALIPNYEDSNQSASIGHFAGGYDAGYYGYMWSKVIAQDLYTRFKEEGITSRDVGLDYRKYILEPGYEKDADKLVESYLGRKFNNKAFMEYLGLAE